MQTAKLLGTVAALAMGLSQLSTLSVRADERAHHVPVGVETRWRHERNEARLSAHPDALALDLPESVYVDPTTGQEIYLPTGETIDHVLPVVAARPPAPVVASVEKTPKRDDSHEAWSWALYGGGAALFAGLYGILVRRRSVRSADAPSSNVPTNLVL